MIAASESFVKHYAYLAQASVNAGRKQYSEVNKLHFIVHLAKQSRFQNPKRFWIYMAEDFVGVMIKIQYPSGSRRPFLFFGR